VAKLMVNGEPHEVEAPDGMPLLWVIRDLLKLSGTKFGCGQALCGACTIHLDGRAVRSCVTPVAAAKGRQITTIEGLASPDGALHPIQQAWVDHAVPQCGFCQSGQIMSAASLLKHHPAPTDDEIDRAMAGNLCRCGTYTRIREAIRTAAGRSLAGADADEGGRDE
jgi:isoquinoline 1-oxidoreductase alpha subunit